LADDLHFAYAKVSISRRLPLPQKSRDFRGPHLRNACRYASQASLRLRHVSLCRVFLALFHFIYNIPYCNHLALADDLHFAYAKVSMSSYIQKNIACVRCFFVLPIHIFHLSTKFL